MFEIHVGNIVLHVCMCIHISTDTHRSCSDINKSRSNHSNTSCITYYFKTTIKAAPLCRYSHIHHKNTNLNYYCHGDHSVCHNSMSHSLPWPWPWAPWITVIITATLRARARSNRHRDWHCISVYSSSHPPPDSATDKKTAGYTCHDHCARGTFCVRSDSFMVTVTGNATDRSHWDSELEPE